MKILRDYTPLPLANVPLSVPKSGQVPLSVPKSGQVLPPNPHPNVAMVQGSKSSMGPKRLGTGGRFIPRIGGPSGDRLILSPGTVTYCRIAQEENDEGEEIPPFQVAPIFPTLNGTPIDAEDPPFFNVAGVSSGAVWLCTQRILCGSPLGASDDLERLVLTARDAKPDEVDGEVHRLICKFDLDTAGSGEKTLENVDQRIASDVDVWFRCRSDTDSSDFSNSSFESSDWNSSDLSDDSEDPNSDDSISDPDCPWKADAIWVNKASCYARIPPSGSVIVGFLIRVKIEASFGNCENWKVKVNAPGGHPKAGMQDPDVSISGDDLVVSMGGRQIDIRGRFYFERPPCLEDQIINVTVESDPGGGDAESNKCCGERSRAVNVGKWPLWCGYASCGTTLLPPP